MKEYSELRRLAEAATKCYGAMRVEKDYNGVYLVVGAGSWKILSAWNTPDGKSKDNAEFHAAASPDAVLALIAELEILEYDCKVANSCVNAEKKESKRIIDENESLKKDAARYRWLLKKNWFDSDIAVVRSPNESIKIGYDCPSTEILDDYIDNEMKESKS